MENTQGIKNKAGFGGHIASGRMRHNPRGKDTTLESDLNVKALAALDPGVNHVARQTSVRSDPYAHGKGEESSNLQGMKAYNNACDQTIHCVPNDMENKSAVKFLHLLNDAAKFHPFS